jgi:hypothetical protein
MRGVVILIMIIQCVLGDITYPAANDYNYNSSTIVNEISQSLINQSYQINLNFSVKFQDNLHKTIWFNSDGVISFDIPYYRQDDNN